MRWIDAVKAESPTPPQVKSVMISAGHSDSDPGAVGHGFTEADIVLELRNLLSDELAKLGIDHLRDGDERENLPLSQAVDIAKRADLAIEFHCNAAASPASGVETLSRSGHYGLGGRLCHAVASTLEIPDRGAKPEDAGPHSRLAFVSDGRGLILELFFITRKSDVSTYLARQRQLVQAIAQAIATEARGCRG